MTTLTSRGRIEWVDAAKAISILLVVLLHVVIEFGFIGIESRWINAALPTMSTMRMPLFFTASGLFAVSWTTRRTWRELLTRKVALLLWVFLVWQPVVLAYKIAEMWWLPNQPENSLETQVGKVLFSPFRPNGELWFLWALALFFVLARATRNLPDIVRVGIPLAISVGWSSASAEVLSEGQLRFLGNGVNGALSYYVFFISAVVYARHIKRLVSRVHPVIAIGVLGGWIGACAAVDIFDVDLPGLLFVLRAFAVAAGFALATILIRLGRSYGWARTPYRCMLPT